MFAAKKIISSFLLPCGIFVSLFFVISVYFFFKNNRKKAFMFLFFGFFIWIFSSNFWINFLICRYENRLNPKLDGDFVVFLSGGNSDFKDILISDYYLSPSSYERLFAVYRIYKEKNIPMVLTGGRIYNSASDAEIAKNILLKLKVSENKIFAENKSKDTYENALYSKEIADKNGFKKPIIVTESVHIKRSVLAFKKAGFEEIYYYPSSYFCHKTVFADFLPSDFYFHRKYFHEILGILFYKIFY
ncbi:MAG: YdcF family protein [Elusimicrobiales bacterium]|nr:YdcF family protein [Elusimicrobiales bacterium]HOJ86419.1 YdcF family protein [Elusimicrobiales bacterium]HOL62617.1 YdcF family protein [Elusimicrobiales bacterium]HPO94576.1 YdcF family protein [Elusimicrobiales bacterium]